MKPTHLKSKKKFSPSIMVWGAIRSDGRRVLLRTNDTIDSLEYQRVLEDGLPLIYNHRFTMQQDGARCHTYRFTMVHFQQKTFRLLLDWGAQSLDLNVIEHMWSIWKKELEKKNSKTKYEIYNAAKDIWELIPYQTIRKLFESLPSRTEAVVNARGGNTKYWFC